MPPTQHSGTHTAPLSTLLTLYLSSVGHPSVSSHRIFQLHIPLSYTSGSEYCSEHGDLKSRVNDERASSAYSSSLSHPHADSPAPTLPPPPVSVSDTQWQQEYTGINSWSNEEPAGVAVNTRLCAQAPSECDELDAVSSTLPSSRSDVSLSNLSSSPPIQPAHPQVSRTQLQLYDITEKLFALLCPAVHDNPHTPHSISFLPFSTMLLWYLLHVQYIPFDSFMDSSNNKVDREKQGLPAIQQHPLYNLCTSLHSVYLRSSYQLSSHSLPRMLLPELYKACIDLAQRLVGHEEECVLSFLSSFYLIISEPMPLSPSSKSVSSPMRRLKQLPSHIHALLTSMDNAFIHKFAQWCQLHPPTYAAPIDDTDADDWCKQQEYPSTRLSKPSVDRTRSKIKKNGSKSMHMPSSSRDLSPRSSPLSSSPLPIDDDSPPPTFSCPLDHPSWSDIGGGNRREEKSQGGGEGEKGVKGRRTAAFFPPASALLNNEDLLKSLHTGLLHHDAHSGTISEMSRREREKATDENVDQSEVYAAIEQAIATDATPTPIPSTSRIDPMRSWRTRAGLWRRSSVEMEGGKKSGVGEENKTRSISHIRPSSAHTVLSNPPPPPPLLQSSSLTPPIGSLPATHSMQMSNLNMANTPSVPSSSSPSTVSSYTPSPSASLLPSRRSSAHNSSHIQTRMQRMRPATSQGVSTNTVHTDASADLSPPPSLTDIPSAYNRPAPSLVSSRGIHARTNSSNSNNGGEQDALSAHVHMRYTLLRPGVTLNSTRTPLSSTPHDTVSSSSSSAPYTDRENLRENREREREELVLSAQMRGKYIPASVVSVPIATQMRLASHSPPPSVTAAAPSHLHSNRIQTLEKTLLSTQNSIIAGSGTGNVSKNRGSLLHSSRVSHGPPSHPSSSSSSVSASASGSAASDSLFWCHTLSLLNQMQQQQNKKQVT